MKLPAASGRDINKYNENTAYKPVIYNIVRTVRNRASDIPWPFNGGWTVFRRWHQVRLLDAERRHLSNRAIVSEVNDFAPQIVMTGHAGSTSACSGFV
jgi:hypothetical protein